MEGLIYILESVTMDGCQEVVTPYGYTSNPVTALDFLDEARGMDNNYPYLVDANKYYRISAVRLDTFNAAPVDVTYYGPFNQLIDVPPTNLDAAHRGEVFCYGPHGEKIYWNGLRWSRLKPFLAR